MSDSKTHYRKVFKSDHLGSADLDEMIEEKRLLVFTIKEVKQMFGAQVAGKKIDANIAFFTEQIKPLVLNATNSKVMSRLTGSKFVEDWAGVTVELYIDASVKMKGEAVGGVRVRASKALTKDDLMTLYMEKEELVPEAEKEAVEAAINGGDSSKFNRVHSYLRKL